MGSALMVSPQIKGFLTEGPFGYSPLTYFYLPKSDSAYLFPNPSNFTTFAAAPLVLTPFVRNQYTNINNINTTTTTTTTAATTAAATTAAATTTTNTNNDITKQVIIHIDIIVRLGCGHRRDL